MIFRGVEMYQMQVECFEIVNGYFRRISCRGIDIHPGERIKINANSYLEKTGGKRIYLDYNFYLNVYNITKLYKKFTLYDFVFRYEGKRVVNNFYQVITPEYIQFKSGPQIFFTTEGMKEIDVFSTHIEKGECVKSTIDGLVLCYGDPKS